MKKLFLLITCLVFSCSVFANNYKVTVKNIQEENDDPRYSIKASYPQLVGKNLGASEKQYNSEAENWVQNRIADFKKSVKEFDTDRLPPEIRKKGSTLNINFKLTTFKPKLLISQLNHVDFYLVGSAHPNQEFSVINYDLKNDRVLGLSDLFKSSSNYLEHLADFSESTLKPKLRDSMFKEGFDPTLKNYRVWNVTPKGLMITFNNYQVAAYVFGPQQVNIPYRVIDGLLLDQSVLTDLRQHKHKKKI